MREEMTTLGESCQFFNGKAHEKDIDAEGRFVVVNSKFISTDGEVKKFTAKQMFPLVENDIVMVMSDVPNGKALAKCYVIEENDKYSLNQRICAIRTNEFNIRFLYYQLNRHPYLLAFNNGENQTNLRKGDILDCPLWKPSLDVQEQIVQLLDDTLDQIDQIQKNILQNIQNSEQLFKSRFNHLFSKGDKSWEKITLLELLERNWILSHLDGNHGGDYPRKKEFIESGIPYLSANCLKNGHVDFSKAKYLSKERAAKLRKGIAQNNDVLFAHNATVGPTALLEIEEPKVILGTSLTYYRCNEDYILPKYLLLYLRSKEFVSQYESVMRQMTRNQVPITKQRKFYHIIPPLTVQKELIPKLENLNIEIDKLSKGYKLKLVQLDELKNAVLFKVFSGELNICRKQIPI